MHKKIKNKNKKTENYLKAVIICHGASEYYIAKHLKSNLRLKIEIDSKNNGEHSIQINSILNFLNTTTYVSEHNFIKKFKDDIPNGKIHPQFKIFIIMDTDDEELTHTDIENYVFSNCTSLQSINIPGSVIRLKNYVFENCTSLQSVVIGEGVRGIGINTFSNCSKLSSIVIPSSVGSVDSDAFYGCVSLESVVFKGTISSTTLNGSAFRNCTQSNLHIYVPWAEGDVENAPWGATNATIHYNYDTANLAVSRGK